MKKKTSFKILKISSIICIVFTLISFSSLSASAESTIGHIDPYTMTQLGSTSYTRSRISVYGTTMTRFENAANNYTYSAAFYYNASDYSFDINHNYRIKFTFRSNNTPTTFQLTVMNTSDINNSNAVSKNILIINSSDFSSTDLHTLSVNFSLDESFNGQPVFFHLWIGTSSQTRDLFDISGINIIDTNPIPSDWESPTYSLEEPDLAAQIEHFQENEDQFFVVDWFRESNPIGNGAKAFLGIFTSVWTQFDRAPWLKLMVTFAIMTSLIGLIVNSASHIHFKDDSYAKYERTRSRNEQYAAKYNSDHPKD